MKTARDTFRESSGNDERKTIIVHTHVAARVAARVQCDDSFSRESPVATGYVFNVLKCGM